MGCITSSCPSGINPVALLQSPKIRKNRKNRVMRLWDKLLLRKCTLIETINDQLKNMSQIQHTRHRSVLGFMVNVVAGLIACSYQPKKPSLGLRRDPLLPMLVV